MGKGKRRKEMSYFDRTAEWLFPIGAKPRRTVCPKCAKVMRTQTGFCPVCVTQLITISYRAKLPKKNAPFKKWKDFWEKHNEWCLKRPQFKNQYVHTHIDHRV